MDQPSAIPQQPDRERAALVVLLYSYGLHDLGDATQEHLFDPMGAWNPWIADVMALATQRVPELALEAQRRSRRAA